MSGRGREGKCQLGAQLERGGMSLWGAGATPKRIGGRFSGIWVSAEGQEDGVSSKVERWIDCSGKWRLASAGGTVYRR